MTEQTYVLAAAAEPGGMASWIVNLMETLGAPGAADLTSGAGGFKRS